MIDGDTARGRWYVSEHLRRSNGALELLLAWYDDTYARVDGEWRFDMIAPDGKRYTNRMHYWRIERPHLIEFDHGADKDNDPGKFRTTITFDEQSDGKTVITLRQLHPTKAQRDAGIGFGAVEYGYQTLEKLAQHVERSKAA